MNKSKEYLIDTELFQHGVECAFLINNSEFFDHPLIKWELVENKDKTISTRMTSSDGNASVSHTCGQSEDFEGSDVDTITLPWDIQKIVDSFTDKEIRLKIENGIQLTHAKRKYTLCNHDGEQFPNGAGSTEMLCTFALNQAEFLEGIKKAKIAASNNIVYQTLCGVLFEVVPSCSAVDLVSANGQTIAHTRISMKEDSFQSYEDSDDILLCNIPKDFINKVEKLCNSFEYDYVGMNIYENSVEFVLMKDNNKTLYEISMNGSYLDWASYMVDRDKATKCKINRLEFIESIKQVLPILSGKDDWVTLTFGKELSIYGESKGIGEAEITMGYENINIKEGQEFYLKAKYLHDAFKTGTADDVVMYFTAGKPLQFDLSEKFTFLIMPIVSVGKK